MRLITVSESKPEDLASIIRLPLSSPSGESALTCKVMEILRNVRERGDVALIEYAKDFDGLELSVSDLRVSEEEIKKSAAGAPAGLMEALAATRDNIRAYSEREMRVLEKLRQEEGTTGEKIVPIRRVGVYIPGGTAPLVSTVPMTVVPAQVAGVTSIALATPKPDVSILAAARLCGVKEIYRAGGAQAIAALAFGTDTIKPVDKIVGPGNEYVTEAKRLVYGTIDIDMLAGPSEIAVIADDTARPEWVAADMLSQAEHGSGRERVFLITDSEKLAKVVENELYKQAGSLEKSDAVSRVLDLGTFLIVCEKGIPQCVEVANFIAPEHLEIMARNAGEIAGLIVNAGAVFVGPFSPEAVGDYVAGPSHVLPTGGTARFASGLSVLDFIKRISLISYTYEDLARVRDAIRAIGEAEGLTAHVRAVEKRFEE